MGLYSSAELTRVVNSDTVNEAAVSFTFLVSSDAVEEGKGMEEEDDEGVELEIERGGALEGENIGSVQQDITMHSDARGRRGGR